MSQPIEIRTLAGVRLDVKADTTIEINMGGLSLLDLESRTATYSNSFDMPRTPVNDAQFEFASQPTRNNRPEIDVIIQKGLFQRQAVLKVIGFEADYKCTITYDSEKYFELLKNTPITFFDFEDITYNFATAQDAVDELCQGTLGIYPFRCIFTNTEIINSSFEKSYNIGFYLPSFIQALADYLNIEIDGTLLTNADFEKTILLNPLYGVKINDSSGYSLVITEKFAESTVMMSTVLKAICQLFVSDLQIMGNKITLNVIDTEATPVQLDGFTFTKSSVSGFGSTNNILYNCDGADKLFKSDTFTAEGVGDKNVLTLEANIPVTDVNGYVTNVAEIANKLNLFYSDTVVYKHMKYYNLAGGAFYAYTNIDSADIYDLSGVYSSILNSIFANPVILEAFKRLDPLTANSVMTQRIINSVQLGGRYWVDSMAYDLQSGNSKMKLIKLQ